MDPDATLREVLELATAVANRDYGESQVDELARHILELDHWITNGGFVPRRWRRHVSEQKTLPGF